MKLNDKIITILGIGEKTVQKLKKLGIKTISDLIYYFPRTWQDFSQPEPIKNIGLGREIIIKAKIANISSFYTAKKRVLIIKAELSDETGDKIPAIWFNQRFLLYNLKPNSWWYFCAKINYDFNLKKMVLSSPIFVKNAEILPVYSETEGINSKYLRLIIKKALMQIKISDWLPAEIVNTEDFFELGKALWQIHFPRDNDSLRKAKSRLAFDELFLLTLQILSRKKELAKNQAPKISINKKLLQKFVKSLPYKLTNAQRRVSWEIICDLAKNIPMNRLLNGDVGSGKTVVAAIAVLNCVKYGYKAAWMAPTEILACQHFRNVNNLLKPFNIKIGLLTSNQMKVSTIKYQVSSNKLNSKFLILNSDLIIGTHSLIQKDVKIENLGLVIIDEQHRFGVKQRSVLQAKKANELIPHFLSMTATPIPRTLALSLYGDLDISLLDEMPSGRQKIITKLVDSAKREKAYQFIREQIKVGRQAFVICPLISTDNRQPTTFNLFDTERKSVEKEFHKLSKEVFPDLKIGMLHGKLKTQEKEKIMSDFSKNKLSIIVSTSVIEIGIDIPNATIIMIEDADRFGLAQLHQFRGRVGRGKYKSYCLLFSSTMLEESKRRLLAMEKYTDGFRLAEIDLASRGAGDFTGQEQSGYKQLKIARLTDIILLKKTKFWAEKVLQNINKHPILAQKIKNKRNIHLE